MDRTSATILVIIIILGAIMRPIYMKYIMPKLSEKVIKILAVIACIVCIVMFLCFFYAVFFA